MKRTKKRKLKNKRTYSTFTAKTLYTCYGDVVMERNETTGELNFICPATIDGIKLEKIKIDYVVSIDRFRKGGSSETQ